MDALRAETVRIVGSGGDEIEAYLAQPLERGLVGAVVVIHHMPGYDEETREITCNLTAHGLLALCPNLYHREAPGRPPEDGYQAIRKLGGLPDEQLVGDVGGAAEHLRALPSSNGKVGAIGFCSGGRQALLAACRLSLDAAVDCYGAFVIERPAPETGLTIEPIIDLVGDLRCPLLGIFGAEDAHPSPAEVEEMAAVLRDHGKTFERHTFEGAGHAFMAAHRPSYRPAAALEAWQLVRDFLHRNLD
jgi:carboxymethylenebutenolidase